MPKGAPQLNPTISSVRVLKITETHLKFSSGCLTLAHMYSMQGVPDLKQRLKIIFLFKIDFFIEGATDELIYIVASFFESCVFLDSCSRN